MPGNQTHEKVHPRGVKYFGFTAMVICLAGLVLALSDRSDPRNTVLLGYSFARLTMILVLLSATLLAATFTAVMQNPKHELRLQNVLMKSTGYGLAFSGSLLLLIVGFVMMSSRGETLDSSISAYLTALLPVELCLVASGILTLYFLMFITKRNAPADLVSVTLLIVVLALGSFWYSRIWSLESVQGEDIYYSFVEGKRLVAGENPYARILSSDMRTNDKYATYFPGFYLTSAVSILVGMDTFDDWISFWRIPFLICALAIGGIMFSLPFFAGHKIAALFSLMFWLFNRWTIHIVLSTDLDFLTLLPLILSLIFLRQKRIISFLLYGLSLAIKQFGIFLLPLYLFWAWEARDSASVWWSRIKGVLAITVIPFVVSLPFLFWNGKGYIQSILFSATRNATSLQDLQSIDEVLGLAGLTARLPMFFLFALIYVIAISRKLPPCTSALLIFAIFVLFNSALFTSYMLYVFVWIPLALTEIYLNHEVDLPRPVG